MSRASSSFRETDVKRALRAIENAGRKVESVEIEGGRVKIKLKNGKDADNNYCGGNGSTDPWDAVEEITQIRARLHRPAGQGPLLLQEGGVQAPAVARFAIVTGIHAGIRRRPCRL